MRLISKVELPEGKRGPWAVQRFDVSDSAAKMTLMRSMRDGRGYVPPGTYTKLVHNSRGIIMSDTPDELVDHYPPLRFARGHVLINGLGLGVVLSAVLRKPDVAKVTVVEIEQDVIDLVAPAYSHDDRVKIVAQDAFTYMPPKGELYGAVWHDIWDNICGDNLPEITRLKRKYGRRTDWQGACCERECRGMQK